MLPLAMPRCCDSWVRCNRCRSGCTAPEYPAPGPVNGGHLRKAWVSLPFLIYRASERHSDQVGKTTKVFRCVPHRNPENTGRVRISGYIGTCVPISEQKLCAFWFGRRKTAGRPPFFRRPERRRSLPLHGMQTLLGPATALSDNLINCKRLKISATSLLLKGICNFFCKSLLQFQYTTPENRLQGAVCFSWK